MKTPHSIKRIELDTADPLYQEMSNVTGLNGGDLNNLLWRVAAPSLIAYLKGFKVQP